MTARVLGKLHETLGQGNYYEAHQMFHSVSQRLLKQKKIGEAIHLLTAGTQAMLQHGQGGSALDLFERLVEALGAPGTVESPSESRDRFLGLVSAAPLDSSPSGIARTDMIRIAVKWSTQTHPLGDPQIHHAVGSLFSRAGLYYDAESHFVLGTLESARALGRMASEWAHASANANIDYKGYYILRSVLQFLAYGKTNHARLALSAYLVSHSHDIVKKLSCGNGDEILVTRSPLLNLAGLVLRCVERGSKEQFVSLLQHFQTAIRLDDFLFTLMNQLIGPRFYEWGPKRHVNPLQEMMKNMFGPMPSNSNTSGKVTGSPMDTLD